MGDSNYLNLGIIVQDSAQPLDKQHPGHHIQLLESSAFGDQLNDRSPYLAGCECAILPHYVGAFLHALNSKPFEERFLVININAYSIIFDRVNPII